PAHHYDSAAPAPGLALRVGGIPDFLPEESGHMNLDSKLFDATLDLERVKVSVRTLVKLSRQEQSAIIRTLNEFGF
ncbi:hypothetical protein, partial [Stenotrophomonas maltophilia]|uniref:hypothetical protein n=1 Tax=Stenotrophomonas maltophilia TaxID=40324 RepID=UPI001953CA89